jgi:hypothetical protein
MPSTARATPMLMTATIWLRLLRGSRRLFILRP